MPATRSINTMSEGLTRILGDISKMKVEPDADLPFLVQLETGILGYLKAPTPPGSGGQQAPPGVSPDMAGAMQQVMGPGAGGGGSMPDGMQASATPGALMANPDETRRMLTRGWSRAAMRSLVRGAIPPGIPAIPS